MAGDTGREADPGGSEASHALPHGEEVFRVSSEDAAGKGYVDPGEWPRLRALLVETDRALVVAAARLAAKIPRPARRAARGF